MGATSAVQLCIAVALLVAVAPVCQASLMAIDLGSEFLKVSLIKPGRTPISIVTNEMSKRKTPSLVGFANGERLLGEEASSFAVRFPETTIARAMDLLGRAGDDSALQQMLKAHKLPHRVVSHPTRGVAAVEVSSNGTMFSGEELVGSLLQYARQIAEAQSGAAVTDAVVAVPAFFGQSQRQALINAASLVGVNIIGIINTHTAAALQFGIERDFANATKHVVFYDMGSGSTVVALVRFSSYMVKEAGKPKPISQLEVRDVEWDAALGSNSLDALLADHFARQFADKHRLDAAEVLGNAKSMAKLRKQVRRTKEMLSANTAGPISVEEFHGGLDFQSTISREQFEQLAGSFFDQAAAPLTRIMARSGLQAEEVEHVELLGGGTRVPRLQAALQQALGGRALDRHMDSDEAVVMGASLFAANLSTSFRLRKFGLADLTLYGVTLRVDEVHEAEGAEASAQQPEERALLPSLKKLPVKRVVHWTNLSSDPLRLTLLYNTSTAYGLPPGAASPLLATLNVTGIDTVIKRYNTSGTVNVRFDAGVDGLLRLDRAEAVVEYTVMEEKLVEVKAAGVTLNTTSGTNSTTNSTIGGADVESEAAEVKEADAATVPEGEGGGRGNSRRSRSWRGLYLATAPPPTLPPAAATATALWPPLPSCSASWCPAHALPR
ncbi:Hsp70 protein-domain-containing protein [Haematococcus lacustris]